MTESRYIHGSGAEEEARLALLNELLNAGCLRELAVRPGERILDVGSGQGQLTRAMARAAGRPAVGVERDPAQLARARDLARAAGEEALLELREGDARSLPLAVAELGTFDLAHARFVLEHVPDPERVVAAMVAAVRPGGRVVLCDDDHDLLHVHPEPPGLLAVWRAFVETYRALGNDPLVGRRLAALLHGAGARPRRATLVFFGSCAGDPSFPGFVSNFATNLDGAREAIAATRLASLADVDRAVEAIRTWGERPDAALWYAMPWVEGVKPG
jgi:SAM-dependent methyltransferase